MKVKHWTACVQDQGKWKEVVEKAKTFNYEVQCLEEEYLKIKHLPLMERNASPLSLFYFGNYLKYKYIT
jgi:hypothetical protein